MCIMCIYIYVYIYIYVCICVYAFVSLYILIFIVVSIYTSTVCAEKQKTELYNTSSTLDCTQDTQDTLDKLRFDIRPDKSAS